MFRKRFLISSALVCVAGFSAGSSHADNFKTSGEWKVTSEDAQGYCTAVQPFSGNTFVTIGERDDGAMSMAFDFQKSVFQTGKTQSAKITAGSVSRTYSAKPKSDSAIVLAVGIDDAFRRAIAQSPKMTLSVNGQTHDFELRNSSKSLSILKECIQALRQAPKQEVIASAVPVAPVQPAKIETKQTSESPQNVRAVAPELTPQKSSSVISTVNTSSLQEENERLKSALADTRRQYENLSAEGNSSARNAEMQEKIGRYEREIQELKSKVDTQSKVVEAPRVPDAQLEAMKTELAASKSRQIDLEAQLAEVKNSNSNSITAETQAIQQKSSALEAEKNAMQSKLIAAEATIANLQSQLVATSKVDTVTKPETTQKITELTSQLNQANTEKLALESELSQVRGKLDNVSAQQPKISPQALQEMQQQTASLSAEKQAAETKLVAADTTIANLQAQLAEMARLKTDNLKSEDSSQKLAALTTQLNQANSEKVALQAQLQEANTNLSSLQKTLDETKSAPVKNNVDTEIVSRLEKELSELKVRNQTLSQNLAEANKVNNVTPSPDAQILAKLQSEVGSLEAENQSLKAKVGELNRNLIESSAEMASVKDIKERSPETDSLRANLQESRQQLDRLLDENAALSADLEKLRNNADQQVASATSGDWNLEQATRRYQEAQREIRRLGSLLEQQRGKCEAEKKDIEYMLFDPEIADREQISQLQSMEAELIEAKSRIRELENQYGLAPSNIANAPSPYAPPQEIAVASPRVDVPSVTSVPVGGAAARVSANPTISVTPQEPVVREAPVQRVATIAPVAPQPTITSSTQSGFKGLLDKAGVRYNSLATNVGSAKDSTTWKIGNGLFGTARSVPVQGSFETMVRSYIQTAEGRCGGEFAAIPVSTGNAQAGAQREAYEIACVNGAGGLSASLLFYQQGNQFVSIAHEGGTSQMEQAMEARDSLDRTLQSSS